MKNYSLNKSRDKNAKIHEINPWEIIWLALIIIIIIILKEPN